MWFSCEGLGVHWQVMDDSQLDGRQREREKITAVQTRVEENRGNGLYLQYIWKTTLRSRVPKLQHLEAKHDINQLSAQKPMLFTFRCL
jgi:hypothetical protein